MQKIFKTLNGVKTRLLVWDDPFNADKYNISDVIVCITGNPGIVEFYIEFAATLHRLTALPLCVVGHAGHEDSDENLYVLENHEHLYNLEGQIMHKYDLLSELIDKKLKLHLIGHSIGAWMIIEILNKHPIIIEHTETIHLLFPTIQKMALTLNGKFLNNVVRRWHTLIMFLFKFIKLLPESIKKLFINLYMILKALPYQMYECICTVLNPEVMEKVLLLAYDEMDNVLCLNTFGIDKIKHLTHIIYSDCDDWAPLDYMKDLRVYRPAMKLTEVEFQHAFVLHASHPIALNTAEYILIACANKKKPSLKSYRHILWD